MHNISSGPLLSVHTSVVSNGSVSSPDQTTQADLGLHCPHMPEDTFLHGTAHLYCVFLKLNALVKGHSGESVCIFFFFFSILLFPGVFLC